MEINYPETIEEFNRQLAANTCCDTCRKEAKAVRLRMIVCPICGNKRCPKATYHLLACTGSNESGQPGSRYRRTEQPNG